MAVALNMGPAWSACMKQEIAKGKAGGGNPARCTALLPKPSTPMSSTVPPNDSSPSTWIWMGVGALAVGGAAWWFLFRKK